MEYALNGSLKQLIDHDIANPQNRFLTDTRKLKIIYGIASAMSYLHSHGILHLDLKPDNILLDDYLFPKVGDFGLSKSELESTQSSIRMKNNNINFTGTLMFIAPEIWKQKKLLEGERHLRILHPRLRVDDVPSPAQKIELFHTGGHHLEWQAS